MSETTRVKPRAVLLDFYGTVVHEDTEPIGAIYAQVARASRVGAMADEVGSYWGRVFGEMCGASFGDGFRCQREIELASLESVLVRFCADLDAAALSETLYDYWTNPAIYDDSEAVLSRCPVPVCVVSNIDSVDLAAACGSLGLTFDYVVTSEDCRSYKPRPEMFEQALSMLDLSADQALHVRDSFGSDVRGAHAMGISVLWVNRNGRDVTAGDVKPDYTAASLAGLLDVLAAGE